MTPIRSVVVAVAVFAAVLAAAGDRPAAAQSKDDNVKLAQDARKFLQAYCAECHTGAKPKSEVLDYNVLDYESLTKKRVRAKKDYRIVAAGVKGEDGLKQSEIWLRVGVDKDMPAEEATKKPTDKEREIIKKWVEAGAPPWPKDPASKPKDPSRLFLVATR
jgi:uncharacterized membrane protein